MKQDDPVSQNQPTDPGAPSHLTSQRLAMLERLARLNQCFLSFGQEPEANIRRLARCCGELLEADIVIYHRQPTAAQPTFQPPVPVADDPPKMEHHVLWVNHPRLTADSDQTLEAGDHPLADLLCSEWLPGRLCYDVIHRLTATAGNGHPAAPDLLATATFHIPDLQASFYRESDPNVSRYGLRTLVGRSVHHGDQAFGSLCVIFLRPVAFSPEDDELFTTLAVAVGIEEQRRLAMLELKRIQDHLAEAVEQRTAELEQARRHLEREVAGHQQTEAALHRKTMQQAALIEAARHMVSSLDATHILERIALAAKEILQGDALTIYLLDDDGQMLLPVYALDEPYADQVMATPLEVARSFTGKAVTAGKALMFNDMTITDEVGVHIPGTPLDTDERMIAAPFVVKNNEQPEGQKSPRILGVMAHNRIGPPFTDEDLALAQAFADYAALALNNSHLHDQLQKEIEERKAAIVALRESQARYRDLFEQASDAILVWDLKGRIIEANQQACQRLGYPAEVLLNMRLDQLEVEDQASVTRKRLKQLARRHRLTYETTLRDRQGRHVPVEINANYLDYTGQPLIIAIARDLSERKAREQERDAVIQLSQALRPAARRDAMVPIILEQLHQLVNADQLFIALLEPFRPAPRTLEPNHALKIIGLPEINQNSAAIDQTWLHTFVHDAIQSGEKQTFRPGRKAGNAYGVGVPLTAQENTIGVLVVSWPTMPADGTLRTLDALADVVASALHRTALHEDTQRQLRRLEALHTIDRALTSIMDLETNLRILVEQVIEQLEVDAADIQLYEAPTLNPVYVTGQGFRSFSNPAISRAAGSHSAAARLPLPASEMARRVALERRLVYLPNLRQADLGSESITNWVIEEHFVSYIGAPLVARGQLMGVLEIFHRSRLEPDQEWLNFMDTLARQTAIAIDSTSLFEDLQRTHMDLIVAYDKTLEGWARALELRDKETEGHSNRVVELTLRLARELGIGRDELVHIRRGALLHDIGKMGLPDSILQKPGPLTPDEWEIMRQHPNFAHELLSPIPYLRPALDIPYCHHERWDGKGYPRGLKGDQIPLSARIFTVIDVFDALRNDRPYRFAWPMEDVQHYLRENAGSQFDPAVVDAFFRMMGWE